MTLNCANDTFGLLASGTSRCWDVAIDESTCHDDEWIAEIEGPQVYLTFQLKEIAVVSKVIDYLGQHRSENGTTKRRISSPVTLGKFGHATISLTWDNEETERCFLVIGARGRSTIRITLLHDDIQMLREAFQDLKSEL